VKEKTILVTGSSGLIGSAAVEPIGCRLPLRRHPWAKYDRAFWEPYLLK
jgi:hypothetical protein